MAYLVTMIYLHVGGFLILYALMRLQNVLLIQVRYFPG